MIALYIILAGCMVFGCYKLETRIQQIEKHIGIDELGKPCTPKNPSCDRTS